MTLTDSVSDQLMAIAAHRYCLSRQQTYIVGVCIEWLYAHWGMFTENTQQLILRDTVSALMSNATSPPATTIHGWKDFARWGMDRLTTDQETWVRGALSRKQQAWPL